VVIPKPIRPSGAGLASFVDMYKYLFSKMLIKNAREF